MSTVLVAISFNSATTFQSWKLLPTGAKMLPGVSFNSATTFQSWKLYDAAEIAEMVTSFNSATTFQSWKRPNECSARPQGTEALQFGHDLSVVETARTISIWHQ